MEPCECRPGRDGDVASAGRKKRLSQKSNAGTTATLIKLDLSPAERSHQHVMPVADLICPPSS